MASSANRRRAKIYATACDARHFGFRAAKSSDTPYSFAFGMLGVDVSIATVVSQPDASSSYLKRPLPLPLNAAMLFFLTGTTRR